LLAVPAAHLFAFLSAAKILLQRDILSNIAEALAEGYQFAEADFSGAEMASQT